jgi:putative copper resistance protein D
MSPVDAAAIGARLLQFTAAAVLGGGALFFLYGVTPEPRGRWPSLLVRLAALLGAAGTLGWLMAQTAQIGDAPADAVDLAKVWSVAAETGFGRVTVVRLALFLFGWTLTFGRWRGRGFWLALALLGFAASASFAWTGHGASDAGLPGILHLFADVLHLVAATTWIGALAVLSVLVLVAARNPPAAEPGRAALTGLVRFSTIGVGVVAVLVASGLVNSWFQVGPGGLGRLLTTHYGQLLLVKIALFGLMLALAAVNRYRLTPRLDRTLQDDAHAAPYRPVVASVLTETALAVLVLVAVSWLGALPPPIDG